MGGSAPPPRQGHCPWTRYRTLQSGKPNSVPMLLGETLGGSAPPPRQGQRPWTRHRKMQSQKPNSVPMLLGTENESHRKQLLHTPWKRNDCLHTGTAAECRLTDALHPGKQKNGRRRKRVLSLSPFFMFSLCPWKTCFVPPRLHAEIPTWTQPTNFAYRSPEDEILWCGVQGPQRPLPRAWQQGTQNVQLPCITLSAQPPPDRRSGSCPAYRDVHFSYGYPLIARP